MFAYDWICLQHIPCKACQVYIVGFVYFKVLLTDLGFRLTKDKELSVRKRRDKQLGIVEKIFVVV